MLLIIQLIQSCPCQNDGICQNNHCLCTAKFLGSNCQYKAQRISQIAQNFNISNQYSFFYYVLQGQRNSYRFSIEICVQNVQKISQKTIFATQQQINGQLIIPFDLTVWTQTQKCQTFTSRLLNFRIKTYGQLQKFIFGIKINSQNFINQQINIRCYYQTIAGMAVNYLFQLIFMPFLSTLMTLMLIFLIIQLYLYLKKRNQRSINQKKFQQLVPSFKYKDLIQQKNQEQQCLICLMVLKYQENVSKTVCSHIFHRQCLELWYNKNPICPVCRQPITNKIQSRQVIINQ